MLMIVVVNTGEFITECVIDRYELIDNNGQTTVNFAVISEGRSLTTVDQAHSGLSGE